MVRTFADKVPVGQREVGQLPAGDGAVEDVEYFADLEAELVGRVDDEEFAGRQSLLQADVVARKVLARYVLQKVALQVALPICAGSDIFGS